VSGTPVLFLLGAALAQEAPPVAPVAPTLDPATEAELQAVLPALAACRDSGGPGTITVSILGAEQHEPWMGPPQGATLSPPGVACVDRALSKVPLPPDAPDAQLTFTLPGAGPASFQVGPARPPRFGSMDQSAITGVIEQRMDLIRDCYTRRLSDAPALGGKVIVRFVVGFNGNVVRATTRSDTLSDPEVASCLNERFGSFQFPPPVGGGLAAVSYPLLFQPTATHAPPKKVRAGVAGCVQGLRPLDGAKLVLAVHGQKRRVKDATVLMADGDASAASSCSTYALADLRPWSKWTYYDLSSLTTARP